MLKNIKIKTRLIFVLAFLSIQLVAGAVVGLGGLHKTNNVIGTIYQDRVIPLTQLEEMGKILIENQLLLSKSLTDNDYEQTLKTINQVENNSEKASTMWTAYLKTYLTPEEKRLADEFSKYRDDFLVLGLQPTIKALKEKDIAKAVLLTHGDMEKTYTPMFLVMDKLIKLQLNVTKKEYEQSQAQYNLIFNFVIVGIFIGLTTAIVFGVWLLKSIVVPLNIAVDFSRKVANGDLTNNIEVDNKDEMGDLLNALQHMNNNLLTIVSSVRNGTDTIATAATQVSAGNMDLSSRTEQQAGSLEETASSMEEITTAVKQNAQHAQVANNLVNSAKSVAIKGGEVITDVMNTIEDINESSKKITEIISVIDGIAFQTNILALNASVEAARAGEQGRGFAVVASEVRNLAQRSAQAAKEIKNLINSSVEKVQMGSTMADKAGKTMEEIIQSITSVNDVVNEISASSQNQYHEIEQINEAISQMDRITQENSALVEEAAAATDSMREQAVALTQAVSVFKVK